MRPVALAALLVLTLLASSPAAAQVRRRDISRGDLDAGGLDRFPGPANQAIQNANGQVLFTFSAFVWCEVDDCDPALGLDYVYVYSVKILGPLSGTDPLVIEAPILFNYPAEPDFHFGLVFPDRDADGTIIAACGNLFPYDEPTVDCIKASVMPMEPDSSPSGRLRFTLKTDALQVGDQVFLYFQIRTPPLCHPPINNFSANADCPASRPVFLSRGSSSLIPSPVIVIAPDVPWPDSSTLAPSSTIAGAEDFTLSVLGTGFDMNSRVLWKGFNRNNTTFFSSTQLTAAIPSCDLVSAGTAGVSVNTPGVGTSSPETFTINSTSPPPGSSNPATSPCAIAFPGGLHFGRQNVGTTSLTQKVTVTNGGPATLMITSFSLIGTNPGDFGATPASSVPFSLGPGASKDFNVSFTPGAVGPRSATLRIFDGSPDSPQTVFLSGTGIQGSGILRDDARVKSTSPNSNYGSSSTLRARTDADPTDPTYRSFLKFDVSGLTGKPNSVTLRLFVTDGSKNTFFISSTDDGWDESSITWNNSLGLGIGIPLGSVGPIAVGAFVDIPLDPFSFFDSGRFNFVLTSNGTDSGIFSSKEASTVANRPQLLFDNAGGPPPPGGTLTLSPNADAQVKSTSANTNYGTLSTLRVRFEAGSGTTNYRSYLKFNVTGLSGTVTSAKLRLFVTDASNNSTSISSTSNNFSSPASPWTETGLIWNNAPAPGTLYATIGAVAVNTFVEITLPASIFTAGNGIYSFVLTNSGTDSAIFSSKEGSTPPQLVLTQGP